MLSSGAPAPAPPAAAAKLLQSRRRRPPPPPRSPGKYSKYCRLRRAKEARRREGAPARAAAAAIAPPAAAAKARAAATAAAKAPPAAAADGEYEVRAVVGMRENWEGHVEMLVAWAGYGAKDNTWEPVRALEYSASDKLAEYHALARGEYTVADALLPMAQQVPIAAAAVFSAAVGAGGQTPAAAAAFASWAAARSRPPAAVPVDDDLPALLLGAPCPFCPSSRQRMAIFKSCCAEHRRWLMQLVRPSPSPSRVPRARLTEQQPVGHRKEERGLKLAAPCCRRGRRRRNTARSCGPAGRCRPGRSGRATAWKAGWASRRDRRRGPAPSR